MEFIAYRVLYYVYLLGNKKYTAGNMDLANLMASLTPEARRYAETVHIRVHHVCVLFGMVVLP